jgi:hypothetical protein
MEKSAIRSVENSPEFPLASAVAASLLLLFERLPRFRARCDGLCLLAIFLKPPAAPVLAMTGSLH